MAHACFMLSVTPHEQPTPLHCRKTRSHRLSKGTTASVHGHGTRSMVGSHRWWTGTEPYLILSIFTSGVTVQWHYGDFDGSRWRWAVELILSWYDQTCVPWYCNIISNWVSKIEVLEIIIRRTNGYRGNVIRPPMTSTTSRLRSKRSGTG